MPSSHVASSHPGSLRLSSREFASPSTWLRWPRPVSTWTQSSVLLSCALLSCVPVPSSSQFPESSFSSIHLSGILQANRKRDICHPNCYAKSNKSTATVALMQPPRRAQLSPHLHACWSSPLAQKRRLAPCVFSLTGRERKCQKYYMVSNDTKSKNFACLLAF